MWARDFEEAQVGGFVGGESLVAVAAAAPAPNLVAELGGAGIIDIGLVGPAKRTFHDNMLSYDYKKLQWKRVWRS